MKITQIITSGEDRFLISFDIVVESDGAEIAEIQLLDQFGGIAGASRTDSPALVGTVSVADFNRGKLPVRCIVTDANGKTQGPEEFGEFLVPRSRGGAGVQLPVSASTVDDFPGCDQARQERDRARGDLDAELAAQDYHLNSARSGFLLAQIAGAGLAGLSLLVLAGEKYLQQGWQQAALPVPFVLIALICLRGLYKAFQARKTASRMGKQIAAIRERYVEATKAVLAGCKPGQWSAAGGCGCACSH